MSFQEIKKQIQDKGFKILSEADLGNGKGVQLETDRGQKISVYFNGTVTIQGKNSEELAFLPKKIQKWASTAGKRSDLSPKSVFVVYGHDPKAKAEAEAMIRRWGIEPLFLDQLINEGQTIIEKLEKHKAESSFAIVLATPCDEGHRMAHPEEKKFRCRQNVVLELGMMLSHFGRSRVAILLKDQENMERPSDIHGLLYYPYKNSLDEVKLQVAKEMSSKGFNINLSSV